MTTPSLSEIGFSPPQIASLAQLDLHCVHDVALHFHLQPEALATYLGISPDQAHSLVQAASHCVPPEKLAALANLAQKPRSFGALPPATEQKP